MTLDFSGKGVVFICSLVAKYNDVVLAFLCCVHQVCYCVSYCVFIGYFLLWAIKASFLDKESLKKHFETSKTEISLSWGKITLTKTEIKITLNKYKKN